MTAIEFLIEKIFGEHTEAWQKEIQQALEMERNQKLDAHKKGYMSGFGEARKYYNETYKKD